MAAKGLQQVLLEGGLPADVCEWGARGGRRRQAGTVDPNTQGGAETQVEETKYNTHAMCSASTDASQVSRERKMVKTLSAPGAYM